MGIRGPGRKPRATRGQVRLAIAHMIAHPDADEGAVCDMFELARTTLAGHRYAWQKYGNGQKDPEPLLPPPPPEAAALYVEYVKWIHPPSERAPAHERAQYALTKRFHELAALWGDWIKK